MPRPSDRFGDSRSHLCLSARNREWGHIRRKIAKTKKEQNGIILFYQLGIDLAKSEQKRYIFAELTGMSGLH